MVQKGQPSVLFLMAKSFYFYGSNIPNIIQFPFPPQSFSDLEVLQKETFETQITSFIDTNKILPSDLSIVLSAEVLFEKEMQKPVPAVGAEQKPVSHAEDILTFLNLIPFEDVDSKSYPTEKGIIVYAVNKQLYDTIKKVFEKKGFVILGVTPAPTLGKQYLAGVQITADSIKLLRQKTDIIKQNSLEFNQPTLQVKQQASKPTGYTKYRLPALIGVFILLIAALPVVYYMSNPTPPPPPAPPPGSAAPAVVSQPTVPPTEKISANTPVGSSSAGESVVSPDLEVVTVKIIAGASERTKALSLKKLLENEGFKNVSVQATQNTNAGKTSAVFSHDLETTTKEKISVQLKKFYPTFSSIENDDVKNIIITFQTL